MESKSPDFVFQRPKSGDFDSILRIACFYWVLWSTVHEWVNEYPCGAQVREWCVLHKVELSLIKKQAFFSAKAAS
jgi:hypothetical protein